MNEKESQYPATTIEISLDKAAEKNLSKLNTVEVISQSEVPDEVIKLFEEIFKSLDDKPIFNCGTFKRIVFGSNHFKYEFHFISDSFFDDGMKNVLSVEVKNGKCKIPKIKKTPFTYQIGEISREENLKLDTGIFPENREISDDRYKNMLKESWDDEPDVQKTESDFIKMLKK